MKLSEHKILPRNKYYIWLPTVFLILQNPFGHGNTTTAPELFEKQLKKKSLKAAMYPLDTEITAGKLQK